MAGGEHRHYGGASDRNALQVPAFCARQPRPRRSDPDTQGRARLARRRGTVSTHLAVFARRLEQATESAWQAAGGHAALPSQHCRPGAQAVGGGWHQEGADWRGGVLGVAALREMYDDHDRSRHTRAWARAAGDAVDVPRARERPAKLWHAPRPRRASQGCVGRVSDDGREECESRRARVARGAARGMAAAIRPVIGSIPEETLPLCDGRTGRGVSGVPV
mmetsp:Transcript_39952/g.105579  ORF Transcript_39952/g.105579 Transcript_39952/m.105579 type:complete len:220 (-) Transcript_39952:52-711(-)